MIDDDGDSKYCRNISMNAEEGWSKYLELLIFRGGQNLFRIEDDDESAALILTLDQLQDLKICVDRAYDAALKFKAERDENDAT